MLFIGPGLGSIAAVTVSGLHAYDTTLLSVHMIQHMVLSMVAPIFLALGAPVTLALRTLTGAPRRRLLAVVHSRVARVLAFPLVAFGLFVVNPFVLYFTGLYRLTLEHAFAHELIHAHFILTGCLFFWPLVGLDPLPGRWPYPARALLMVLSVPFHTVLGLTIMQSTTLLGGDWYPSLALGWADPWADQKVAGGVLWAGGEFVSVTMLARPGAAVDTPVRAGGPAGRPRARPPGGPRARRRRVRREPPGGTPADRAGHAACAISPSGRARPRVTGGPARRPATGTISGQLRPGSPGTDDRTPLHRPAVQRRPAGPRPDAARRRAPVRPATSRSSSSTRPPTPSASGWSTTTRST